MNKTQLKEFIHKTNNKGLSVHNISFVKKTYKIPDKIEQAKHIIKICKDNPKLKYLSAFKRLVRLSKYPEHDAILCGQIRDLYNPELDKIIEFLIKAENKLNKEC